ncbi:amino acid ABC transporter permease, partial [Bacillus sp. D-CC]
YMLVIILTLVGKAIEGRMKKSD